MHRNYEFDVAGRNVYMLLLRDDFFELSMANSTIIPLQGTVLLHTQLELVVPTTVAGTLYGIALTLFYLYVDSLVPQLRNGDRKRQTKFMLGYSVVIMLCGLYSLVFNAWVIQDGYINHADFRGGPFSYIASTFNTPVIIVGLVCQLVIDVLTSAIQVHSYFPLVLQAG
jgi:hypothetical protein